MKLTLSKIFLSSYIISLGFYTLFNPGGIFPFCLLFSILLFLNLFLQSNSFTKIIFPRLSVIDLLLFILNSPNYIEYKTITMFPEIENH